jgi:hypothetical protein
VHVVTEAARSILDGIRGDHEFPMFKAASMEYSSEWSMAAPCASSPYREIRTARAA